MTSSSLIVFAVYCAFVALIIGLYVWWALTKWDGPEGKDDHDHLR